MAVHADPEQRVAQASSSNFSTHTLSTQNAVVIQELTVLQQSRSNMTWSRHCGLLQTLHIAYLSKHCSVIPGYMAFAIYIDIQAASRIDRGAWQGPMLWLTIQSTKAYLHVHAKSCWTQHVSNRLPTANQSNSNRSSKIAR